MVVKAGQAVIALDGEHGTLSEVAIALAEHIPVISLGDWILPKDLHHDIIPASSPRDAVEKAIAAAKRDRKK
jgi:predicted Rossmann-fold nucleotide-binding protein